jgi:hypothetical protein
MGGHGGGRESGCSTGRSGRYVMHVGILESCQYVALAL